MRRIEGIGVGVSGGAVFLGGAVILMMGNAGGRAATAGHGATGAPGENGNVCVLCHNGGPYGPILELLEVEKGGQLVATYTPGQTYDVTMTVMENAGNPSGYGFQLTALDGNNKNAGTFGNLGANVKESAANNVGGRKYLEHKGGASATGAFSAKWTAPPAKTGTVTMYYVGNVVNGNGAKTGDNGGLGSSITLLEGGLGGLPLPYFDDFDLGPGNWSSSDVPMTPLPTWTWGVPQAATGGDPGAWGATGGVGAGPGGLAFFEWNPLDLSGFTVDPIISFAILYDTELDDVGGWLESSVDGGASWFSVGGVGEGLGWYDGTSPLWGDWWSGSSGGWSYAEHSLDGTAGLSDVRVRFVFTTELATSFDGLGIDDVWIDPDPTEPPPPDPGGGDSSGADGDGTDDGWAEWTGGSGGFELPTTTSMDGGGGSGGSWGDVEELPLGTSTDGGYGVDDGGYGMGSDGW